MDEREMAERLKSLAQLDIDAVHAYNQAIERIDVQAIRVQLTIYRDDHGRHVRELSQKIAELGFVPPEYSQDFKGFLIEGMTTLQSILGTAGALTAMQTNEMLTNGSYAQASALSFRPDIKALVERNYGDEQRHLQYIKDALANRLWRK